MRNDHRKLIALTILAVSLLWLVIYLAGHITEFKIIFHISPNMVVLLSILVVLGSVLLGLFTKVLMQHFQIPLRFKEWFGLSMVTAFWNYLMPFRGGAGVRAIYLKKAHNFAITSFLGTMAALYFIHFLVNSIVGLICVLLIYAQYHYMNVPIASFFLIVFVGVMFFIGFSPQLPQFRNPVLKKISEVTNGWYQIRRSAKLIIKLIVVTILNAAVGLFTVYFAFKAYGIDLSLPKSLLVSTLFAFSTLVNLTPGSLGIAEAIMVFSAQIFNITPAQSLVAAGLIRLTNLCVVFILGPIFNYVLSLNVRIIKSNHTMPLSNSISR